MMLPPQRIARWRKLAHWVRGRLVTPLRVLPDISRSRRYAYQLCDLRHGSSTAGLAEGPLPATPQKSCLRLGVIGGFPVLEYVRLGYDWLAPYYNPLLMFEEVHYFQTQPAPPFKWMDWSYRFYIHQFADEQDIIRICQRHEIHILRAYDAEMGQHATEAAKTLNIPVVVSVH